MVKRRCSRIARLTSLGLGLVVVVATAIMAPSATAIVNGELAGDRYPAVGTVALRFDEFGMFNLCSGFLISPSSFVTAGHCARDALKRQSELGGSIGVVFDPTFDRWTSTFWPASGVAIHPENLANPLSYKSPDMAVLSLEDPVVGVNPIDLPALGRADDLGNGDSLTTVGYGFTQECDTDIGHCQAAYDPSRRFATERVLSVSQWFLTVGQNENGQGTGGVCYGDSGGPHLIPGTNTAVALTTSIFGGQFPVCRALSRHNRLDTATALDFLTPYVSS